MTEAAKQIWINGENGENTWICFRRKIKLDKAPKSANVKIAVDSKYRLYINGSTVVFEGGLKRGPSKHETYYDELDITRYLKRGENTIAVLVRYFGKNGFSHLSSGMGGMMFEADIDKRTIVSDETWKAAKHPAYVKADENDPKANFRLPESNIYFDAAKDLGAWYEPDYDDGAWQNADSVTPSFGGLKPGRIPMFKDHGMRDYINSSDYSDFTADEDTALEMRLPYNAQITPYLRINAPAGKRISIKTDTYNDFEYDTKSVMSVYYTRGGEQEYEFPGWMNGETVIYNIPAGVCVRSLKYRETGYNTEFAGSFECDDDMLNTLWQKSLRTLYVTMRDNFMDCPDRERTQWWGDVNSEMQMMMYSLDENALALYKKGVDTMAGWAEDNGYMLTVVPTGADEFELPLQNLAGIWGFRYYYEYTGDKSVPERAYYISRDYVMNYEMRDGLAVHRAGSWDWPDWGDNADIAPMENAWYYMALSSCRNMARLLGIYDDIAAYTQRMDAIKDNYDRVFWKGEYYYDNTANGKPDDRANALAVLSGLAGEDKYGDILNVLQTVENSSPYMEKYVLDAMCESGFVNEAAKRMKRHYREMTEFDYSTLWEYWNKDGTLNHAWSGGPLITMSKYIAGIRPVGAGYEACEIKPCLCGLNYIKCVVPSVKGKITLEIKKEYGRVRMSVSVPEGVTAYVYPPSGCDEPPFKLSGGSRII